MLSLEPADRVIVVGTTGTGKTMFVREQILAPLLAGGVRVVALDVKDELSVDGVSRPNATVGPLHRSLSRPALRLTHCVRMRSRSLPRGRSRQSFGGLFA